MVLADRQSGLPLPIKFPRPETAGVACRFGPLAFSRDPEGRFIAAGSVDNPVEGPIACVWDSQTGALVKTARGHLDLYSLTAIDLSADSRRLLTASEDGTARIWDLAGPEPTAAPVQTFRVKESADDPDIAVTAARFCPTDAGKVVTGTIDGQVLLWREGQDRPLATPGTFSGDVRAVVFSRDGKWLAAAGGLDKNVRLWALSPRIEPVRLTPSPHHTEIVNALIAWPNQAMIASGSDDTTIRLWELDDARLLGTLSAEGSSPDWVAFTPEGLFDGSIGAEAQVTWLDADQVLPLDQFAARARVFQLTDQLRRGVRPEAPEPPSEPPPRVAIDPPPSAIAESRDATLTITLGEAGLSDVRLYQNGVPVGLGADLGLTPERRSVTVPVRLQNGVNRFHAMANRAEGRSIDGRSEVVEIRYDGPEATGQIHVLALGVSEYRVKERALKFADHDAEEIANFLHKHGMNATGQPGLQRVLTNADVSERAVDAAFQEIRDRVAGRPEDTVVVFLAGHTDVLLNRFQLLLTGYPFPKQAGERAVLPAVDRDTVLPYAAIYRNIARLNALQRLVVVDACQSDAIHDDPAVRRIREAIDNGSYRARTAYFLAARRGEPAGEVSEIEHGLLTYVLLKGMGDRNLKTVPEVTIFDDQPTADRNHNGVVTTEELRWFTDLTLPKLAYNFPTLVRRSGDSGPARDVRPTANLDQSPSVQTAEATFPLVEVPEEEPSATVADVP